MFASQASRLAEHCGRITGKEAAKRDSVRRQLERHLPTELLAKAGLLAEPPHCMVGTPLAHEPICHMPALAACVVVDVRMAVSWLNTWESPIVCSLLFARHWIAGLYIAVKKVMHCPGCLVGALVNARRLCPGHACLLCLQVSVPPTDIFLLPVSPADLARLPAAIQQAADAAAAAEQHTQQVQRSASQLHHQEASANAEHGSEASAAPGASEASAGPGVPLTRVNSPRFAFASGAAGGGAASTMVASAWLSRPDGPSGAGPGGTLDLALENARLRAELASLLAQAAAKELAGIDHQGSASSSVAAAADLVKRSMHASILMAASQAAPTSSGQPPHPVVPGAASISLASASSHQQQADDAAPVAADVATGAGAGTGGPAARPYGHGGPAVVPASVAASLPQLSALLQQTAAADAEAAASAAAKQALSLAPVQVGQAAASRLRYFDTLC